MTPETVQAILDEIAEKDFTTASHIRRVALYTRGLAELAGVDGEALNSLTRAAALHDIGKLDIPLHILNKACKLTDAEYAVIKSHTVTGYNRLIAMGEDDPVVLGLVRHHHERWDGLGYPDRLKGRQIPVAARFFSVVDSFDALTSARPYRHDLGVAAAERALGELRRSIGRYYCGGCVSLFEELYRSGRITEVLESSCDETSMRELKVLVAA